MKKLPLGIRILLGFISFLLCVALFATTLCAALLGDLSVAFRKDNLQKLITQTLFSNAVSRQIPPASGVSGGHPHVAAPVIKPDSLTVLPDEADAGAPSTSALVEWIYNTMTEGLPKEDMEDEAFPTLEEVQSFVEESTLSDFLAEKSASLVSDIITGENTTTLTVDEIKQQLENNAELIEKTFNIPMDAEVISQITTAMAETPVIKQIQEEGVNSIVQDLVDSGAISIPGMAPNPDSGNAGSDSTGSTGNSGGLSVPNSPMAIINTLRSIVSTTTLLIMIGICLALIGLLLLVNMKQIWVGVRKAGFTIGLASLPLCAVTIVALFATDTLNDILGGATPLFKGIMFIVNLTVPVHFGILALGVILIVSSFFIKRAIRKKYLKTARELANQPVVTAVMDENTLVDAIPEEAIAAEATEEAAPAEEVAEAAEETVEAEEAAEEAVAAEAAAEEAVEEEAPAEPV